MTNAKQDFSNKPTARLAYLNEQRDEESRKANFTFIFLQKHRIL